MSKRLTKNEFIHRAGKIHGNKYDYSEVEYENARTKVKIICPEHGEFWQTPDSHLSGNGCVKCGGSDRKTTKDFVRDARKIHGDKYDYNKVNYVNAKTEVCIIYPGYGEFWQRPDHHLQGYVPNSLKRYFYSEKFIRKAKEVHGEKYNYSKTEYVNIRTKLCIICPKHGEFWQRPDTHLNGCGCPKCIHKESSYEESFLNGLKNVFLESDFHREYNDDARYPFKCDFYIKSLDLFIELNAHWTHGKHWFDENNEDDIKQLESWQQKNIEFYQNAIETWTIRDVNKRKIAADNNLNYVVLWNQKDIDQWFSEGCSVRRDWR